MKIATFNVNSIKMREAIVKEWLAAQAIDVLALQETKTTDELFPAATFKELGYTALFHGQKAYNGVAILAKADSFTKIELKATGIPGYPDSAARVMAVRFEAKALPAFTLIDTYFPNGQEVGSDKYIYKLDWIYSLRQWLQALIANNERIVLLGDMNIAPADRDVWNPEAWRGSILVSAAERTAFNDLIKAGLVDTWALESREEESYSWWDYRFDSFSKNHGLRIDHILITENLKSFYRSLTIDKAPRSKDKPSDHTPVVLELGEEFTLSG